MNYTHFEAFHNLQSPKAVLPFIIELLQPTSVLDVGCGLGHWLQVASELGVSDILGVDQPQLDVSALVIPGESFVAKDLSKTMSLDRHFDLAICLEVAEHLPPSAAEDLVQTLVSYASVILFSAAIPGQGGQNHINEQWPAYWQQLFAVHGYIAYDVIRPVFWNDKRVDPWYRQNMIIYAPPDYTHLNQGLTFEVLPLVHPEILGIVKQEAAELAQFRQAVLFNPSIGFALKALGKAMLRPFGYHAKK